jgi:hypothetical protein
MDCLFSLQYNLREEDMRLFYVSSAAECFFHLLDGIDAEYGVCKCILCLSG